MLYDLSFLQNGKPIVPEEEKNRIREYQKNLKYYNGDYKKRSKVHYTTFDKMHKEIEFDITKINLYKLVTNKFIALMLNERPVVKIDNDKNNIVQIVLERSNFWDAIKDSLSAFSYLGDGVVNIYNTENGIKVTTTNPQCWYKVVNEDNINEVKNHVLIWDVDNGNKVKVQIHYKGYYETYVCNKKGNKFGDRVEYKNIPKKGIRTETVFDDFSIIDFNNNVSIDNVYGTSDYKDIEMLVKGIEKRISLEDKVVDKHIEPTFMGPSNLMQENEQTGRTEFSGIGGFIPVNSKDSPQPGYITWDGKTEASEKLINRYLQLIYTITEFGEVFFTGTYSSASGEALKTLMKSALDKVNRQANSVDHNIKKSIKSLLDANGVHTEIDEISINWQDGIKESLKTITEIINSRFEKGTLSIETLLKRYDKMTEEQAKEEAIKINNQ